MNVFEGSDPYGNQGKPAEAAQEEEPLELSDDEQEHVNALAEAKAEAEKLAEPEKPEKQPEPEQVAAQEEKPEKDDAEKDRTVPLAALQQERAHRQKLEQQVAFLAGQTDALKSMPKEEGKPEPDPFEEIESKRDELAKDYEEGTVSFRDYRKAERELNKIEQEVQRRQQAKPSPEDVILNDPRVVKVTRDIEAANPWVRNIPPNYLNSLQPLAVDIALEAGYEITPDASGTMILRAAVVEAAKRVGYDKLFSQQPQQPQSGNGQQKPVAQSHPSQEQPKQVSPTAQDRAKKLGEAKQHPPSMLSAGVSAPSDSLTGDRIMGMSEEELMALPDEVLKRYANGKAT